MEDLLACRNFLKLPEIGVLGGGRQKFPVGLNKGKGLSQWLARFRSEEQL
jgi:hypothetical protein